LLPSKLYLFASEYRVGYSLTNYFVVWFESQLKGNVLSSRN